MAQSTIHVALEIGTSKTCMVVGEVNTDGTASIIGIGEVPSQGVRRGEIVDQSAASRCVRDAWSLAQDHADAEIRSICLSITGSHFIGENNMGSYRLPDELRVVTPEHMDTVREKAESLEIAQDRYIVDSITGYYSIDGKEASSYPVRLTARTLDVSCHIIHGFESRIHNSVICVRQVPLEIEDLVFAPIATAHAILTREHKEAGALLIDIGAGTTDYVLYLNGDVVASGCIPVGGNHINQDIVKLSHQRVNFVAAEVLKRTEGNASGDMKDSTMAVYRDAEGRNEAQIERGVLNRIIYERLYETLLLVKSKLPTHAVEHRDFSVYLSGGASMMRGLDDVAESIFQTTVFQPDPVSEGDDYSFMNDPRYCTAIGLIRMAQIQHAREQQERDGVFTRFLNFILRR